MVRLLKEPRPCGFSYRLYGMPVKEFATDNEAIEYQREKEREDELNELKRS